MEERFRKEKKGNPDTPQHQSEGGKDQVVEVSTTDTQQQGNQLEATDSQHIKGGDENNNQQHHTEDDHQSTAMKHNNKQGENVVELDQRDEKVVSHLQDHRGEGEQLQAHTDLGDNANNILQMDKQGIGDEEDATDNLQAHVKDVARSGDLSPKSIKGLNKDKKKGRHANTKNSHMQTRSSSVRPAGSR